MSHGLLRLGVTSVGVLTLLMSAIFVFPYGDASGLLPLSSEMDCVKLCFLNIRPGLTTLGEALEKLSGSEWVKHVRVDPISQLVGWDWTGLQPRAIDTTLPSVIEYHENVVLRIHLLTRIPLGDVILRWANVRRQPSISAVGRVVNIGRLQTVYYLGNGYVAAIQLNCHDFWRSPTALILGANARYISGFGRSRLDLLRFKRTVSAQCT